MKIIFILLIVFSTVVCINAQNNSLSDGKIYTIVEEMPSFPGGDKALMTFIYENLIYPESDKENLIEGLVILSLTINSDGSISDIVVLNDLGKGCGEEALRIVNSMPKWDPGKQNGIPVAVSYKLPIRFEIDAYEKKQIKKEIRNSEKEQKKLMRKKSLGRPTCQPETIMADAQNHPNFSYWPSNLRNKIPMNFSRQVLSSKNEK